MNTLLEIKNVSKYFGSGNAVSKALNGVSFSMERSEFTAIIGASGSGKSTLLNVIATIDRPSSGSILLEGRDIVEMKEGELAAFHNQDGVELLLWLAIDLVMVFLTHFTLSRTLTGMLLRCKRLKSRGTNTVVLRDLSGKMTVNALLIGALATLLVFAIVMSNVAFGDKVYTDLTIEKECPYDVIALYDLSEEPGVSMDEGREIIEKYSPITGELGFQLHSAGDTILCSSILGYDLMEWTDLFMPLSQFNRLLTGCGYDLVSLENEYLLITDVQGICDVDFSVKPVTLNGQTYTWAGSSLAYPDFARRLYFYFVVPDEAVANMPVAYTGAAYTPENHRPDAEARGWNMGRKAWRSNAGIPFMNTSGCRARPMSAR